MDLRLLLGEVLEPKPPTHGDFQYRLLVVVVIVVVVLLLVVHSTTSKGSLNVCPASNPELNPTFLTAHSGPKANAGP